MGAELYWCIRHSKDSWLYQFLLGHSILGRIYKNSPISFLKAHKILKDIDFPGDLKTYPSISTEEHLEIQHEHKPLKT